jgi:hypothetical protein
VGLTPDSIEGILEEDLAKFGSLKSVSLSSPTSSLFFKIICVFQVL